MISGAIEVVLPVGDREQPVVMHRPRQFTGEINMLSARRSLVRGRVEEAGEVIAVDRQDLRLLVQRDSELSEILLRAFILRRVALLSEGSDLVLVGSQHSADTLRIKEFLSRNGQPFIYQDVETDPSVQALLDSSRSASGGAGDRLRRRPRPEEPVARGAGGLLGLAARSTEDAAGRRHRGAGPAGLAAAVYGASEGSTCSCSKTAPGGQAGTSSRIENYLGFPTGISGQALAAGR